MPFISLCMIARNEAPGLKAAIESCAGVVDEVIVVDTGSTDDTVQVGAGLGARVFHQPWQDSFSAARNFGLDQARGDWHLVLDCDETLRPEYKTVLMNACRNNAAAAFTIDWVVHTSTGSTSTPVLRVARADAGLRLRGRVHEKLAGTPPRMTHLDVKIDHFGYLKNNREAKASLYNRLLLLDLAENPGDNYLLTNLLHNYWGAQNPSWKSFLPKAIATLDRDRERPPHALVAVLLDIVLRLAKQDEPSEFSKADADALAERWFPGSVVLGSSRARWHAESGKNHAAVRIAVRALGGWTHGTAQTDISFNPGPILGDLNLIAGVALARLGRTFEGIQYLEAARAFPTVVDSAEANLSILTRSPISITDSKNLVALEK